MANGLITIASAPQLLLPGAMGIMMNYDLYPNEWKEIFTIVNSHKNTEVYIENEDFSGAGRFGDAESIPMTSSKQVFTTYAQNYNYGVGFAISANMLEDNLYPDQFPRGMLGIKESLQTFQEFESASYFDNAFGVQTNPDYILGDGQPLCSTQHPVSNGVISNLLNNAQLSLTSYQDLIVLIQQFESYSGQPRKIIPTHLFVGIPNQFAAAIITGSQYDPTSANNAINPLVTGGYIHGKYVVSHYMSNPYNYFLMTDYRDGALLQRRKSLDIQMTTDQSNRNLSVYGCERYRFIIPNFRCVAGVQSLN